MSRPTRKSRGFTLLEIILIVFALFIVALATLPQFTRRNTTSTFDHAMKEVQNGCEQVERFVTICARRILP